MYIVAYSVHTKRAIVYDSIIYLGGGDGICVSN